MTGLCAVFLTFTLYVLTHWAICRFLQWRPLSPVLNRTWLCFLPVYGLLFFLLATKTQTFAIRLRSIDGAADFLNGLLINCFLLVGYTIFFFLIERGLSLRVIIEIHRSPQRKLTIPEIMKIYTFEYILEKRLGQMLQMGYAVNEGGTLRSTERTTRLVAANKLVRTVFRIKQVMP